MTLITRNRIFALICIVGGFAIALTVAELVLRARAQQITLELFGDNPANTYAPNELRILVLGESTSAGMYYDGKDGSWPRLLEQRLQRQFPQLEIRVTNYAFSGTITSNLVQKTLPALDDLRPHIVVTMMGVNDLSSLEYLHAKGLRSLRIVKALTWGLHVLGRQPSKREIEFNTMPLEPTRGRINAIIGPNSKATDVDWTDIKKKLEALQGSDEKVNWAARLMTAELIMNVLSRTPITPNENLAKNLPSYSKAFSLARENILKANEAHPTHLNTLLIAMALAGGDPKGNFGQEVFPMVKTALKRGMSPSPQLIAYLSAQDTPEVASLIAGYDAQVDRSKNPYAVTIANYRKLFEALDRRGTLMVAMQYPRGTRDSIVNLFVSEPVPFGSFCQSTDLRQPANPLWKYSPILVVDNMNFEEAIEREGYDKFFVDRFGAGCGARFGHTTQLGHRMIAENLAPKIAERIQLTGNGFRVRKE